MKLSIVFVASMLSSSALAWSQAERSDLRGHMSWCLKNYGQEDGRQGVKLYQSGSDTYRAVGQLKEEFARCQAHNFPAVSLLNKVTDREFTQALNASVIELEAIVWNHMNWVANHENKGGELSQAANNEDAYAIRDIFNKAQRENPTARVNLKAVSDEFLIAIGKNY